MKSDDGGATWNDVSPPLPPDPPLEDFQPVAGLAVAPSDPGVLYLLQGAGWRSDDAGANWMPLAIPGDAFGSGSGFDALAVDAGSPSRVYSSDGHQVFRSLDSGSTWQATPLSGDIRQLLTDPTVADVVVARSETEVFVSSDGGTTWRALPPIGVTIDDLAVGGGEIYAATGMGVFTFHDVRVIPSAPDQPAPATRRLAAGPSAGER
ncbi:MAG TPA: hypothetical protein VFS34_01305 [Thermoanaerobaculia bacterium]|nr:hypothetical protein [Thermoanaerobaculia bacterium]